MLVPASYLHGYLGTSTFSFSLSLAMVLAGTMAGSKRRKTFFGPTMHTYFTPKIPIATSGLKLHKELNSDMSSLHRNQSLAVEQELIKKRAHKISTKKTLAHSLLPLQEQPQWKWI